jgi:hypothetical protein
MRHSKLILSLVALGCLLAGPAWAAQGWPWAGPATESLGGAALVVVGGELGGPGPKVNPLRVTLLPCGEPGCDQGPALRLPLTESPHRADGQPLTSGGEDRSLALELPAGSYRLAELEALVSRETGQGVFFVPLHYIFQVRPGRTSYLGRLTVTALEAESRFLWAKSRPGELIVGQTKGGPEIKLTFHLNLEDSLRLDQAVILRAYAGRSLPAFIKELAAWMKK